MGIRFRRSYGAVEGRRTSMALPPECRAVPSTAGCARNGREAKSRRSSRKLCAAMRRLDTIGVDHREQVPVVTCGGGAGGPVDADRVNAAADSARQPERSISMNRWMDRLIAISSHARHARRRSAAGCTLAGRPAIAGSPGVLYFETAAATTGPCARCNSPRSWRFLVLLSYRVPPALNVCDTLGGSTRVCAARVVWHPPAADRRHAVAGWSASFPSDATPASLTTASKTRPCHPPKPLRTPAPIAGVPSVDMLSCKCHNGLLCGRARHQTRVVLGSAVPFSRRL